MIGNMSLTNSNSHESEPDDIHGTDLRSEDAAHGAGVVPGAKLSRRVACKAVATSQHSFHLFHA